MAPMPACSTRSRTSSWSSFSSSLRIASTEPRASALRITLSSVILARALASLSESRLCGPRLMKLASRSFDLAVVGDLPGLGQVADHVERIVGVGDAVEAGDADRRCSGPASVIGWPRSLYMARTRP